MLIHRRSSSLIVMVSVFFVSFGSENAFCQQKPGVIKPAEKLADGWEEIDERLIFLMVRLANVEASLDAIDHAIGRNTVKKNVKTADAKRAEKGNEMMDRKGGGPMKWNEFYGTTAEAFFYHPVDRNTTYHTLTVLRQMPNTQPDSATGVPSNQGVPPHQRPPQFDYIYRANRDAKARAEEEAAQFKNKIDALIERRQRLEAEQAGLWCEVAFRAVSHYDLDKKPLYRFEPLLVNADPESRQHGDIMKTAVVFMRSALSIVDEAQKDQATTFSNIRSAVSDARQNLSDGWLRQAVDVTDRKTPEGKFAALAKRLDDVANNLADSYMVSIEGDQAKDQQRKDTFRALLQESLVNYARIILAMDEMATLMKDEWKIKPNVDKPLQFVSFANVEKVRPIPQIAKEQSPTAAITISSLVPTRLLKLEAGQPRLYDSNPLRVIDEVSKELSGWQFISIPQRTVNSYEVRVNKATTIYAFGGNKKQTPRDFFGKDAAQWKPASNAIKGINVNLCFSREVTAGETIKLSAFELQIAAESIATK